MHIGRKRLGTPGTPLALRARWWRTQFLSLLAWWSGYLRPGAVLARGLTTITNMGARFVLFGSAVVPRRLSAPRDSQLKEIVERHRLNLVDEWLRMLVWWVSHVSRHSDNPFFLFLSQDLESRLHALRSQGRRSVPTASRIRSWEVLENLGLQMVSNSDLLAASPIAGLLGVRRNAGMVFRWAEGWLGPIARGVGWHLLKADKAAVAERVRLLSAIFVPIRMSIGPYAVEDERLALVDT